MISPHRLPTGRLIALLVVAVLVVTTVAGGAWLELGAAGQRERARGQVPDRPPLVVDQPLGAAEARPLGHVFVVVLENESADQVLGSPDLPYLNGLVREFAVAANYHAVARPSQPNYIALVSGSTQGIEDNRPHDVDARSLFDQIEAAGRDWRVYAENVPPDCFTGEKAQDGTDGSGTYVRKHEPAISFRSISSAPERCAKIQPLSAFDPAAADFELIVPNLCHDMHDCAAADTDRWLADFVPRVLASPSWRDGGALFVTFDEGDSGDDSNQVLTVVAAPGIRPNVQSVVPHTHYSLLRTIQEGWGLPCLAESCRHNTLGELLPPGIRVDQTPR